jgi:hypothetical protein
MPPGGRILLLAILGCAAGDARTVRLKIRDEHGRPAAARVRVFDDAALPQAVKGKSTLTVAHPRFPALGAVAAGQCEIELPAGSSSVRVDRGAEYLPVELKFGPDNGTAAERTVRLRRWVDMAARGWWSGDLHVHRPPSDMPVLMEAADLHFAPVITRWNDRSSMDSWPEQRVIPVGANRAYSINNSEDERGWGAALFFGLQSPIRLYAMKGNEEYPPALPVWQEARRKSAFIDLEKAIWWGAPVIAALMRPDTIGVANNHFAERQVLDTEAWGRPRDRAKYPGPRGFAHYIFDLYYTYLNCGWRIPASAGSANGVIESPLGYDRSYVYLGPRFSYHDWLAGQRSGRNFVTNGPMLFLTANGRPPGTVMDEAGEVSVRVEAWTAGELENVELIVDGVTVKSFTPGPGRKRFHASLRIAVRSGGWLAARCFEKSPVTVRFAHSSPVYFGRTPARSPEALASMLAWIDAETDRVKRLGSLSEAQRGELLGLCRQAREVYH